MDKEKEAYRMTSGNGAPNSSGPRFKSSSKRRIYIVIGVVCLLIVVAVAIALGVYFGVRGCKMDKVTLTVKSSDCNTYVAEVSITSSAELTITEKGPGVYVGEVCGMPATLSLRKEGFEPLTTTVTGAAVNVTLTCSEPNCTVQAADISVISTCASSPVEDVTISGQNIIGVTSSTPGFYKLVLCSQPTLVNIAKNGYASQQTTVRSGSTVRLPCKSPIIIKDPQSKYRSEGENVTLCCQTKPDTGVTYKWYKDGTELASETNNELSLTSLVSNDQGLYQCSAKLTADPNLPAVRSEEAMLTIRAAASDNCADALRPNRVEVYPGCYHDVGQCLKRSCRSSGSGESCSDDNTCCEVTRSIYPDCARGKKVTKVTGCLCRCPASSVLEVTGTVKSSDTGFPLTGIIVRLVGNTVETSTDENGNFVFSSVPSSKRRLVAKASDSAGNYLDNYVVKMIPDSELLEQVILNIAMIKKASFIEIDPVIENKLSISGNPTAPNSGSTYLKVPANVFYNTDGTQYTGKVSMSLSYIDPTKRLEDAPGEFVTLNQDGQSESLVTLGVFTIEFKGNSGNQLLLNDNIGVYAEQSTPYLLWQLDEETGTWILINNLPGRKKRQDTQERLVGSFTPQKGRWYNIDYVYSEPDCFFKIRVFQSSFTKQNEVTSRALFIPKVRQILAISDGNGVKYGRHGEFLTRCIRIKCPAEIAKASISVTDFYFQKPLKPATIEDYSTGIKTILQASPFSYTLSSINASQLFVNTKVTETGPFYADNDKCMASTFDDPAFWFTEPPEFVEGDFYDGSGDRCVGKVQIVSYEVETSVLNKISNAKLGAMSIWSDSKYGMKQASIKLINPLITPQNDWTKIEASSCFEYRCSAKNDMTSVYLDFSNNTFNSWCHYNVTHVPILSSSEIQRGYFLNEMSNVEEAVDRCEKDTGNYAERLYCNGISNRRKRRSLRLG